MTIDEINRRLPLPEVIHSLGMPLPKNKVMLCPFHNDTSPSLAIYNKGDKWRFKCYSPGCRAAKGGDVIDFIKLNNNCSENDAKRRCEELCGHPY